MNKDFAIAFDILDKVFREGAYSNILLNQYLPTCENRGFVTKLVYGVLEKNITLEYYIAQITDKLPQKKVLTLLKLGSYIIKFVKNIPDFACVNEMVELCDYINKKQMKGFVNATLKSLINAEITLPNDEKEKLSIEYSIPLWLVKAYFKQLGRDNAIKIICAEKNELEHIRPNERKLSIDKLLEILSENNIEYKLSEIGGAFVKNSKEIQKLFKEGLITIQSPSSMYACKALGVCDNTTILDMCSSPGGKAVYLSELAKNLKIIACDIHQHRLALIESYSTRMGADNIECKMADGTVFSSEFSNKFDYVLCDAPCSGYGVAHKKPDIYLNACLEDSYALAETQYAILNNAIDYCVKGGIIVYSTCTTLREENYNIIGKILKERNDIALDVMPINLENKGFIQLFPEGGMDGFFIARLKKI